MRPLLVLILVVGALAAFYFAFNTGSAVVQEDVTGADPVAATTASSENADLVTPDAPDRDTAPLPVEPEPRTAEVGTGGSFTNRLEGQVVNPNRKPIEGASVVLSRIGQSTFHFVDDDGEGGVDRSDDLGTRTDKEGRFRFDNAKAYDGYALHVTHADYGHTEVGQVSVPEQGLRTEPVIVMRPGTRVFGTVIDSGGASVGAAEIVLGLPTLGTGVPSGPGTFKTESQANGSYEFKNVSEGKYTLTVVADGYGRLTLPNVTVTSSGEVQQDLTLEVAQMLGGRVVSTTGEPIKGAVIQAFSMIGGGQQSRSQTKTNAKGEFRLDDIPAGTYTVLAREKSHKADRLQRIEAGDMGVQFQLVPLPAISGRVIDAATNKPLSNFSVRLREPAPASQVAMPVHNTRVNVKDASGVYTVFAPKSGTYVVEASADNYADCFSEQFAIEEGQQLAEVVVRMTKGGVILGRVVDSTGQPIGGATIGSHDNDWTDDQFMQAIGDMYPTNATTRSVRTKADGSFKLEGLTPATYQLDIKHSDYSRAGVYDIAVRESQETAAGDIVLPSGGTVRGTVYGPSGEPLPGAVVNLSSVSVLESFPLNYSDKTNAKGQFEITHVKPGSYNAKAMRSAVAGADPFQQLGDMKQSNQKVEVKEGQEKNGVDFRLDSSGGR